MTVLVVDEEVSASGGAPASSSGSSGDQARLQHQAGKIASALQKYGVKFEVVERRVVGGGAKEAEGRTSAVVGARPPPGRTRGEAGGCARSVQIPIPFRAPLEHAPQPRSNLQSLSQSDPIQPPPSPGEVADEVEADMLVLDSQAVHNKAIDANLLAEFVSCPVLLLP